MGTKGRRKRRNRNRESQREASPLLHNNSPSPYQGEGDKGDRVTKQISKGVRVT